jgi:2-methylisocitrate lyase-like PEP mutase family enzyme
MTQSDKYRAFAALHVPGDPVILFNVWDAGSAKAVAEAGASAIATGSASVAGAHGFTDAEGLPIGMALANAALVVGAVDLPVTIDFEGAYAVAPDGVAASMARLAATGAIGCNFEDQIVGGEGLHDIADQAARIAAARNAVGADFFINARTDLFLKTQTHDDALIDQVIERGRAFADSGASGFFVPRLSEPRQVERVVREVPLPLNLIAFPGAPPNREWASAGAARISFGPFPHKALMKQLEEAAREALASVAR